MRLDFSIFFAYTYAMSKIYISELASPELIEYLVAEGHELAVVGDGSSKFDNSFCGDNVRSTKFDNQPQIKRLKPAENVDSTISCHPDILHCHLAGGKVFHGDMDRLGTKYPADVLYNACSTGKYFIHNLKHTAPELLAAADDLGLIKIDVAQGYARCSVLPVDENSVITYDRGIAAACARRAPAPDVLLVSPGHIGLPGYATGFIGGTGGRIGDAIVFNGDLSAHPDFESIKDFIESRGLKCIWTSDIPLTDIGSIIEEY